MELAMEIAVNETNQQADILPDTFVNIQRYNSWDPDLAAQYAFVDSGGFAIAESIKIAESGAGEFFEKACADESITILTKITVTASMLADHAYDQAFLTLLDVDARYIFIAADITTTADFYYFAANYSLIGPKYVWLGVNTPVGDGRDLTAYYGPKVRDLVEGYVAGYDATNVTDTAPMTNWDTTWNKLMEESPIYTALHQSPYNWMFPQQNVYDCTKVILLGIHQKRNFTPEMLASGSLTHFLSPSVFSETGYNGLSATPIEFDINGDIETPVAYVTIDWDIMNAVITNETMEYGLYNPVTETLSITSQQLKFNGGGLTPPPDGPINKVLDIPVGSAVGIMLIILSAIGCISDLSLISVILKYRKRGAIRAMSPMFSIIFGIGALLADIGIIFSIGAVTEINCSLKIWFPILSAALTFGALIVKNFRVYTIAFHDGNDNSLFLGLGLIVGAAVALLVVWQHSFTPIGYIRDKDGSAITLMCFVLNDAAGLSRSMANTIAAYVIFLIAGVGYMSYVTSQIPSAFSESGFLSCCALVSGLAIMIIGSIMLSVSQNLATIVIRNVVMWAANMANKAMLIVPRWIELYRKDHETFDSLMSPSVEKKGLGLNLSKKKSQLKGLGSSHEEMVDGRVVPFVLLGAACIRFRWSWFLGWSTWKRTGMVVISKFGMTWIVFDYDDGSQAVILGKDDVVENSGNCVKLQIQHNGKKRFYAKLEFETISQLQQFCETWRKFKKYTK
ncbi:hypothetical protein HDU76_008584 [Blyttiomyces sp. JEL0837]|nr:hypothetical protein HDU76_008584 [Blyttiomyces sp. JEL0837]